MRRIKIDPAAFAAGLYLLFVERSIWAVLAMLAAALHELGHLIAAGCLHVSTTGMKIGAMGVRIALHGGLISYRAEALIAAAGPTVNLLCVLLSCVLFRIIPNEGFLFFAAASLALAAVNLLPLPTLDGGRIAYCLIAEHLGPDAAGHFLSVAGGLCAVMLWLAAAAFWLRTAGNLSLLVLSCLFLRRGMQGVFNV